MTYAMASQNYSYRLEEADMENAGPWISLAALIFVAGNWIVTLVGMRNNARIAIVAEQDKKITNLQTSLNQMDERMQRCELAREHLADAIEEKEKEILRLNNENVQLMRMIIEHNESPKGGS